MNIQATGNPRPKRGGKRSKKQRPKSSQTALEKAARVSALSAAAPASVEASVEVHIPVVEVETAALLGAADHDETVLLAGPASVPCTDEFTTPLLEACPATASAVDQTFELETSADSDVIASVQAVLVDEETAGEPAAPVKSVPLSAPRVMAAPVATVAARSSAALSAPASLPAPVVASAPKTFVDRLLAATQDEQKWLAIGLFYMMAGWIIVNSGWVTEGVGYPLMLVGLLLPPIPYLIQHYLGRGIQIQQAQKTLARCEVRATRQGNNSLVYEIRSSDFHR